MKCWIVIFVLSSICLAGCAGPKVSRGIRPEHVGTKYARLTGYFATAKAAPGGRHEEDVRGNIQHDVILDEATLTKLTPTETCFQVMVRSESQHDEPLEQLSPECSVAGQKGPVVVENEQVTVVDYSYQGMQSIVRAEGVAASQYMGMSIEQPVDKVFRVVVRNATLCCPVGGNGPAGGAGKVELALDNSRREVADFNYTLAFEWNVR